MKKGFLSGSGQTPPKEGKTSTPESHAENRLPDTLNGTGPTHQPTAHPSAPVSPQFTLPEMSEEEKAKLVEKCLVLLSSKRDEEKLVGLLLVSKLLSTATEDVVRRLHAALGPSFLGRLMLPLRTEGLDEEGARAVREREVANRALAVAVLAGLSRLPDLALSETLLARLPSLSRVLDQGGVGSDDPSANLAVLGDALEALANVAGAGEKAPPLVLASGTLSSCALALRSTLTSLTAQPSASSTPVLLETALRSTRLLALLLPHASDLTPDLVHALLLAIALPGHIQRAKLGPALVDLGARLQLQAFHCLALAEAAVPPATLTELLAPALALPTVRAPLRAGLALALRSRSTAFIKQLMLRATATIAELAGTEWLLGPSEDSPDSEPGSFLLLLATVLGVEVHVLLLDALSPDQPVPDDTRAALALIYGERQGPAASSRQQKEEQAPGPSTCTATPEAPAAEEGQVEEVEEGREPPSIDLQELSDTLMGIDQGQAAATGRLPRPQLPMTLPEDVPQGKGGFASGTITAGRRAEQLLPPVLALLELAVEAVAFSEDSPSSYEVPPARLEEVFQRVEGAMQQLADFVGEALRKRREGEGSEGTRGLLEGLVAASTRCLGRFLAEAPEALHAAVLPQVPEMLALPGAGLDRFLLPWLSRAIHLIPDVATKYPQLVSALLEFSLLPALHANELDPVVNAAVVPVDALQHLVGSPGRAEAEQLASLQALLLTVLALVPSKFAALALPHRTPDPEASNALIVLSHLALLCALGIVGGSENVQMGVDALAPAFEPLSRFVAAGLAEVVLTLDEVLSTERMGPAIEDFAEDLAFHLDAISDSLVALLDASAVATGGSSGASVQQAITQSLRSGDLEPLWSGFLQKGPRENDVKAAALGVPFQLLRERLGLVV